MRTGYTPIVSLANVIVARLDSQPISGAGDLNGKRVGTLGEWHKALILDAAPSAQVVLVGMDRGLDLVRRGALDMYVNRTIRDRGPAAPRPGAGRLRRRRNLRRPPRARGTGFADQPRDGRHQR